MHAFRGEDKSNYDQTVQVPASIKEKTTSISITPSKNSKQSKADARSQKQINN